LFIAAVHIYLDTAVVILFFSKTSKSVDVGENFNDFVVTMRAIAGKHFGTDTDTKWLFEYNFCFDF